MITMIAITSASSTIIAIITITTMILVHGQFTP